MHFGSFTLTIESRNREDRTDKMNRLFDFLAEHAEDYGFEGFEETENHWGGMSYDVLKPEEV